MKIVAISDTHEKHEQVIVPQGDVLIHAGDFTYRGDFAAVASFANWLKQQTHQHKIVIAGNHELTFQSPSRDIMVNLIREAGAIYLENSGCEIGGLHFYGSPYTPYFFDWAFNIVRNSDTMIANWDLVPENTNILISHGPPYGILDSVQDRTRGPQGCEVLRKRVEQLPNLKAHIFGHLHRDGGQSKQYNNVIYVNAAICDDRYDASRSPLIIEV